jgi:hypothetical protein
MKSKDPCHGEWSTKKPLIVTPKDKQYKKMQAQLKKRGFCDSECWNLDMTMSQFLLPRLKRFKEINHGFPNGLSEETWNEILDKIITSLEWNIAQYENDDPQPYTYQEGFDLLGKWYTHLWD